MLRGAACLALAALLGAAALSAWTAEPAPALAESTFESEIDVSLLTLVVRVVDTWGNPVLGLEPKDFRVHVGALEVPVVALDWVSASGSSRPGEGPAAEDTSASDPRAQRPPSEIPPAVAGADPITLPQMTTGTAAPSSGRLVVVFVQADLHPTRISGQMRLRPHTRELLAGLHPDDRVAVVSFDSHLKLRQDFARDWAATTAAIDESMVWNPERPVAPAQPFSLVRHFDRAAAREAASPERALELTARALAPLPGEKTILYLGWGMGRYTPEGVRMRPSYKPALRALYDARAAVFVLDVTSADYHSLEVGLQEVAAATGGAYYSTFRLPALATRTLARAISGYYVLTLDHGAFPEQEGKVSVELRGKSGTVLARPVALYAPAS